MNITYIITGLYTGGAEMMLYKQLSQIDRNRFSPSIISLMNKGTIGPKIESELGIPVYTLNIVESRNPIYALWRLRQIIRSIQPDLIQGKMYHGNLVSEIAKFFVGRSIPVLWSIHHTITQLSAEKRITQWLIKLGSRMGNNPDRIIFVSQNSRQQHETLGYPIDKSCTIPNGCDVDRFSPDATAHTTLCESLGIAKDSLLIGSVARFHPMKDHHNLLQAAALTVTHYPNLHFVLIGRDVTEDNPELHSWITAFNLGDRVHVLGERSDTPQLMAGFDLFTSTSAYGEAFPNVLVEAMSCGTPCVTTNVGDSGFIVENTGKVVEPRDAEGLSQAWRSILQLTTTDRTTLGIQARQRVIDHFSLRSIVDRHESLYEEVLFQHHENHSLKSER